MKILLINPPWLRLLGLTSTLFPLNLGYLAAELRKHDHEPIIYDADFDLSWMNKSFAIPEKVMRSNYDLYLKILHNLEHPIWQEIRENIEAVAPDIVGITSMTASYGSAIDVAKCVKQVNKDIIVILGGVHPTVLPEETIREPEVDLVVRGESEITLVKVIEAIEKRSLSTVGIQYENKKFIVDPMPESTITDINHLEFPARDLLLNLRNFHANAFGIMISSRGCPFNCIFCSSHKMWGHKVRFRSASNVVEEIVSVNKSFGTDHFYFQDDTFTLRENLVLEFCKNLKREDIKISWSCPTRVDFITPKIVREMKSAGCNDISVGIESGSEETLKRIGKNISLDQVRSAVKIIKNEGIRIVGYFVFGFPWEAEEHFKMTLNLIEELDLDIVQYNFAVPLPGTELYTLVEGQGILPPHKTPIDWSRFYQHSQSLPFSKHMNHNVKMSTIEYIETRIGELSQKKAMHRRKKYQRDSRIKRFKYYLQNPAKLASRLCRIIVE